MTSNKTSQIENILSRAKRIFLPLLFFLFLAVLGMVYAGLVSGELNKRVLQPITDKLNGFTDSLNKAYSVSSPIPTPSSTSVSPAASPANSKSKVIQSAAPCNRFTVPHLDGSSSSLCYSAADYNKLVSLKNDYTTAEIFYKFNLDSADKYQREYDRTGAGVYLDGKQSALDDAGVQKQKMDSDLAQMAEIEARGK